VTDWKPLDVLDDLTPEAMREHLLALQTIIARTPVPIAIAYDPHCRFISANRALAALLRVPPDTNISLTPASGKAVYRIQQNGRDLTPHELPMQYAIAHRTPVHNDIEIVRSDGTVAYVRNDVEPLYDTSGEVYGCVSVCVDFTDQKLAEIGLRDADRRKDEFLATLSHELRNPLAPIRTAIEIIRLAQGDLAVSETARTTIERQLTHLVRITDDLLDVARITQDKMELRRERIDLRAALHSAVEATRPLVASRSHTLTIDMGDAALEAKADFTRMTQVFTNLLHNAAKYTPNHGQIHLSARAEGSHVLIAIADSGAGIPPPMLTRIFEMFTQLQDYRDRAQGGLGIGLTLAKRLVELHGGTIEARSAGLGCGSRFVVRLPLARGEAVEHQGNDRTAPALRTCRVLVADDNPDAAEMLRVMLQMKGHHVRVAADGVQAVATARAFTPQIAFVDIGMPRMDGYAAGREIRRLLGPNVVLVALTGWGQDDDKRRSREAGFDHHLTKPPEPEMLDLLIATCPEQVHTSGDEEQDPLPGAPD
jgi:signal transduction histidine kinase/CheY-like chemotaxis protein